MPTFTKKITTVKEIGFVCDRCDETFYYADGNTPIKIEHYFGYFSKHDCNELSAVFCENCLHEIMMKSVKYPKNVFRETR